MADTRAVTNPGLTATISPDDLAWRAILEATQGTHEVLGELARDADGAVAFVGRPVQGGDHVILKLEPESSAGKARRYSLFLLHKLDETVPAPRIACAVCSALVASWRGTCPACGNAIGAGIDGPLASDVSLAFHHYVTGQYDLVAEFPVDGYGPAAYLVRSRDQSHYVILRLAMGGVVSSTPKSYLVDVIPLNVAGTAIMPPSREPLHIVGATEKMPAARDAVRPSSSKTPVPGSSSQAPASITGGERVCPQCGATFGGATLFCPRDGASLRSVSSGGDLVGQLIDDRYHVGERLGEGGMGEVYIAQQVRTGRKCALKLMHVGMTRDADAVGRFRREASSACAISHPHVATIYDSGETLDHRPYFAMEFVDGRPLSHIIRDEGSLAPWRAADIARQIAEGLAAAHDIDIVHRDLKPDNVMLGAARGGADFVKLVDFGIAKPTKGTGNTLTKTGFVLGTPAYMSPEQICADKLDGRTDLYSLGCVLYEMLIGVTPWADDSIEAVMMRRLTEPPASSQRRSGHPRSARRRGRTFARTCGRGSVSRRSGGRGRVECRARQDRSDDQRRVAPSRPSVVRGAGTRRGVDCRWCRRSDAGRARATPFARCRTGGAVVTSDPFRVAGSGKNRNGRRIGNFERVVASKRRAAKPLAGCGCGSRCGHRGRRRFRLAAQVAIQSGADGAGECIVWRVRAGDLSASGCSNAADDSTTGQPSAGADCRAACDEGGPVPREASGPKHAADRCGVEDRTADCYTAIGKLEERCRRRRQQSEGDGRRSAAVGVQHDRPTRGHGSVETANLAAGGDRRSGHRRGCRGGACRKRAHS